MPPCMDWPALLSRLIEVLGYPKNSTTKTNSLVKATFVSGKNCVGRNQLIQDKGKCVLLKKFLFHSMYVRVK